VTALALATAICGVGVFFYLRFRTMLNPPSIHALAFAAQLAIYAVMQRYAAGQGLNFGVMADVTNVIRGYLIASVSFGLPWLLLGKRDGYLKIDSITPSVRDIRSFKVVLACEIILLFLAASVAIGLVGFPLGSMLAGRFDVNRMNEALRSLPPGLLALMLWIAILLSLQLATAITFRRHYRLSRPQLAGVGVAILLSSIWEAKRQVLLIMLLLTALFMVADRARRTQLWRVLFGLAVAFAAFWVVYVAVQFVRVGNVDSGPFYLELILSSMWPLLNLDRVMAFTQGTGQLYSLVAGLIPNRFFGHGYEGFQSVLFEPTSSVSYVLYAYFDFGYFGIAGAAFVFGLVALWFSSLFKQSITGVQVRALVLWTCLSSPIYAHAFSINYFLIPVSLLFLIRGFSGGRMYVRSTAHAPKRGMAVVRPGT